MASIPLQYFYLGPMHNTLATVSELIAEKNPAIRQYHWTPQTLTGTQSGSLARVWAHESADDYAVKTFVDSLSQ